MSIDIEDQLVAEMRHEVGGVTVSTWLVDKAAQRHGRRVAVRRGVYVAGVVGMAGVLATAVTLGSGGSRGAASTHGRDRGPVAPPGTVGQPPGDRG
jgi:hypothetical protein